MRLHLAPLLCFGLQLCQIAFQGENRLATHILPVFPDKLLDGRRGVVPGMYPSQRIGHNGFAQVSLTGSPTNALMDGSSTTTMARVFSPCTK